MIGIYTHHPKWMLYTKKPARAAADKQRRALDQVMHPRRVEEGQAAHHLHH